MNQAQKEALDRIERKIASAEDFELVCEFIRKAKRRQAAGEDTEDDRMILRHIEDFIAEGSDRTPLQDVQTRFLMRRTK